MAAYVKAHQGTYPRQVLGLLLTERVYDAAEEHFGAQVGDDAVRRELDKRLAGSDADQQYAAAAQQGYSRRDVFEVIREQLVRMEIAQRRGLAGPLSEASLQQAYQKEQAQLTQRQLGTIQVPDQATADAVIAQLDGNPGSYPQVAAQHAGDYTTPALQAVTADQIPSQLQQGVAAAAPNTAFSVPGPAGGVVVVFVGPTTTQSFEQVRPQLEAAAQQTVDTSAQKVVSDYRKTLKVTVNPRYGVLGQDGTLSDPTGGAVTLLGTGSGTGSATASASPAG
jgi:peptidyl-prolyl cis-trans isomerase SurA